MLEQGHEYGTTTGRERRCGWIDLVALRYAVRLNRMSSLAITKLDVLSGLETLRVAVRYRSREGALLDSFPYHQSILHSATPEYEELPGFGEDITGCRNEEDLPPQARAYLDYIADFVGVPIRLVGVGPSRDQIVWRLRASDQADQGRRERGVLCTQAIEDADMRRPEALS